MLTRFSPKLGAAVFGALALVYMVAALATGHSARAEAPVLLAPEEAGLDVWRALSLMVDHAGELAVVDVRSTERFESYHLPRSRSVPDGSADDVREAAESKGYVLLVAETDAKAGELVAAMGSSIAHAHFLKGGAAEWYLALELPAELFSSKPPPHGYLPAVRSVRTWLETPSAVSAEKVRAAIQTLAAAAFAPDQLGGKKKAPAGGKKKKIAGGCS